MDSFLTQTKVVFKKNIKLHTSSKSFWLNLYIPIFCSILSVINFDFLYRPLKPIYLTLAISGVVRQSIYLLVEERSGKHKEIQKIMGLSTNAYYAAWVLSIWFLSLLTSLIFIIPQIITQAYKFEESSLAFYDVIFSYSLYSIALSNMMMFFSSFFEDAKKSTEFIGFFNLFASFVVISVIANIHHSVFLEQIPSLFLPQTAVQLSWLSKDWLYTGASGYTLKYFVYILNLLIQIFGYLILFLYFDQVIPHSNGGAKHPLFMLSWFKKRKIYADLEEDDFVVSSNLLNVPILSVQQQQRNELPIIHIENLSKRLGSQQVLNGVSLDVYQGEVYCLLGPNGAGKSTLMNIMTGFLKKQKGVATICGIDIDEHQSVKQHIGICMQKDILYESLSVYDHLFYYGKLKNIPDSELDMQIQQILNLCLLRNEESKLTNALSGGNKRKLCLALALIGDSKVLFLDEPSSGLDPITRQQLWQLIQNVALNRAIFMTTHHMEDAEALASKVGILFNGQIVTQGSVDFIKLNFGVGYHLSMEFDSADQMGLNLVKLQSELSQIDNSISLLQINTTTVKAVLPIQKISLYHSLLNFLEQKIPCKYSIQMNSLEDSYLAIEEQFSKIPIDREAYKAFLQQPNPQFIPQVKAMLQRKLWNILSSKEQFFRFFMIWPLIWMATLVGAYYPFAFVYMYIANKALSVTFFGSLLIEEQKSKIKPYMYASGMQPIAYWVGTVSFDIIPCFVEAIYTWILLWMYNVGFYPQHPMLTIMMLTFISMAISCFVCFFTQILNNPVFVYLGLPLLCLFVFFSGFLFILFIIIEQASVSFLYDLLGWLLMMISPFISGFVGLAFSPAQNSYFFYSYGSCILWMILSSSIYMFFCVKMDINKYHKSMELPLDENTVVEVNNVNKTYNGRQVVTNLNLNVQKSEIYGLLGPNGAGKSTTFNMISQFEQCTNGTIKVKDSEKNMGLVPQFCPFYPHLTVYDHLSLYGQIKGQINLDQSIDMYLKAVDMERIRDRSVIHLSGGERRKVQLGIALIGGSNRLFMDEPTTGLDPKSKKVIQTILGQSALHNESSIIITTHSMQEAQTICNRVGIMVNGQLVIQGPIDFLRQQLGNSVRFTIQCNAGRSQQVKVLIQQHLGNLFTLLELPDQRENYVSYQIPAQQTKLSMLFYFLQIELKQKNQLILNFQIFQTSLDQIFAFFSAQQQPIFELPQGQQVGLNLNPMDMLRVCTGACCCVFW